MKTLYIASYYNAPHFIAVQKELLSKYSVDIDFVVANDADDTVPSLLSPTLAKEDIEKECNRLGVRHVRVPQSVHLCKSEGGLVPNGFPCSHPTERHRACLHWILRNHKIINENNCELFVLSDTDLFPTKFLDFKEYMEDLDILGTGRRHHVVRTYEEGQYWPDDDIPEMSDVKEMDVDHLTMYIFMADLRKVLNLESMDIGGFAGTDTGGKSHFFLKENNYRYKFLECGRDFENQAMPIAKSGASETNLDFIHILAGGSNWDYQSLEYYKEKIRRILLKYIPELTPVFEPCNQDLESKDGQHKFLADGQHVYGKGHPMSNLN